ncbi:MAG: serine/threonine protein kinase [Myxococcales bacterium]|nr:serine/threonine protein kinase [Myxococcales bacterium]
MDAPIVPGYQLDRLIGEGGFGQVWRAIRPSLEVVAIKVLHLELVRSIDALTRFQRELEAIERLHHRNVVRAMGHGALDDGRPFLVLEYLEGPSLREVLHERGALPPAEMLEMFLPLCDALMVAHAAGLVHRDVKASNVILARDAAGLRPVLLDFGLVKLIDQVGPGLTSSRSMLGTPAAMAPEQMRGQPVDARTDVYALGLLAFHMLTGQPAFGGAPGVVQSYMQIHGARPRPSTKAEIDPAIDAPIGRALAPEQRDRFATPRELYDALHQVIHPTSSAEVAVVALYAEGLPEQIAKIAELARGLGMAIAVAAPDSVLAVIPMAEVDVGGLRGLLAPLAAGTRIAVGASHATIQGSIVDGPALDAEAWAPYPLPTGLWVADTLQ